MKPVLKDGYKHAQSLDLDIRRGSSKLCSTSRITSSAATRPCRPSSCSRRQQALRMHDIAGLLRVSTPSPDSPAKRCTGGVLGPCYAAASVAANFSEDLVQHNLDPRALPQHVAVIMDGNGRWARQRGQHELQGHRQGVHALKRIVELCKRWHIPCLTGYAFSSENWLRDSHEVALLLELTESTIKANVNGLHETGVRVCFMGDRASLPQSLQRSMHRAEQLTACNTALTLTIAVSYGGQNDIARAAAEIAQLVADDTLHPSQVTEQLIASRLGSGHLPNHHRSPDLIIRTGGEQRLSNFMLYEAAYAELYFCPEPWPMFDEVSFATALRHYASRQRRFGGRNSQKP